MPTKKISPEAAFLQQLFTDEIPAPLRGLATLSKSNRRAAKKDPVAFFKKAGLNPPPGIKVRIETEGVGEREVVCGWFCWPRGSMIICGKICAADPDTVVSWL